MDQLEDEESDGRVLLRSIVDEVYWWLEGDGAGWVSYPLAESVSCIDVELDSSAPTTIMQLYIWASDFCKRTRFRALCISVFI
jgi:hypothetical protein